MGSPARTQRSVVVQFNPPPGWTPPPGFDPRRGHLFDPTWPAAPAGWEFWVPMVRPPRMNRSQRKQLALALGIAVVLTALLMFALPRSAGGEVPTGLGSCWAQASSGYEAVRCSSDEATLRIEREVSDPSSCPESSPGYFESGGVVQCLVPVD